MKDFLIKFLTTSLFAGGVFILAKILSVWIGISFTNGAVLFQIPYNSGALISMVNESQLNKVLIISDIVFVLIVVTSGALVLGKTILFNDLTRNPRILIRVIHMNLSDWLEDGKVMYPKLFAWNTFLWLATAVVFRNYLYMGTPIYITAICFIFTIYYTYQVFSFLETHISDMISYMHGEKGKYI